jgi:hypothetical protein
MATFWINRPHEGPDQYEFDFMCIDFTDGVKRFICKSSIVPEDYWPKSVYLCNTESGYYEIVGSYKKENNSNGYLFIESYQNSSRIDFPIGNLGLPSSVNSW